MQTKQKFEHEQADKLTYVEKLRVRDQELIRLQGERDLEAAAGRESAGKMKERVYALNNQLSELEEKFGRIFKEKNALQR